MSINSIVETLLMISETIQYSLLYSVIGTPLAYYNNKIFPIKSDKKRYSLIFWECVLHVVSLSLLFLLLKYIVQKVPFILHPFTKGLYIPYKSEEYAASVSAYIFFFYLQVNLTDKLTYLGNELFRGDINWLKLII